jgi:predicted transcriptional regulator
MSKEVFVIRIPPSLDRRIDRAADLNFDGRSEIVRRAARIGLALIRDKKIECDDHHTFEDRNVRLAVRVDPTLRRHLTLFADQHWTTRAGVLRAALHYGLWKLGAH